jgi:hypothetical protein
MGKRYTDPQIYFCLNLMWQVSNLKMALEDVKKQNVRCLTKEPTIGAHGKPVMFLHPKDMGGVLVELEENFHDAYKKSKKGPLC